MAFPVLYICLFYKFSFINCLCFDQSSLVLIKTSFTNLKNQNFCEKKIPHSLSRFFKMILAIPYHRKVTIKFEKSRFFLHLIYYFLSWCFPQQFLFIQEKY